MQTLREKITEALADNQESWEVVEHHTLTEEELAGYYNELPYTLWTKARVYFPAICDMGAWVESVPRNPNNEATEPVGG